MQGPRLELGLRHGLLMTPMMQQAVQLLVLSTLELQQHIEQELETNPTLEMVDDDGDGEDGAKDEASSGDEPSSGDDKSAAPEISNEAGALPAVGEAAAEAGAEANAGTADADIVEASPADTGVMDDVDYENIFSSSSHENQPQGDGNDDAGQVIEESSMTRYELLDYCIEQLERSDLTPEDRVLARILLTNLDDQGYFSHSVMEFARNPPCVYERTAVAGKAILDEDEGIVKKVYPGGREIRSVIYQPPPMNATALEMVRRYILKHFDPPGVAAENARESLLMQLERRSEKGTPAYVVVRDHFDDVVRNRMPAIARALKMPLEQSLEIVERVKRLESSPSRSFGVSNAGYVIPDVAVEKVNGEYVVTLKDDRIPRVRVSRNYLRMYEQQKRLKNEVGTYLKDKLDSAFWLIKSIQQRQKTLYRVSECIVRRQRDFLEYGPKLFQPMTLRVVADDLGIHESTVSRVTTNKYMQTPRGTFELKYFFTAAIGTGSGEDASARAVKTVLQEIVAAEDTARPYSDQRLAELIGERGYHLARRTVTKYREELGVMAAKLRMKY